MIPFITTLIILNIFIFFYVAHVMFFIIGGINYLNYAYSFLLEKNNIDLIEEIREHVHPSFQSYIASAKSLLMIIFATVCMEAIMIICLIVPEIKIQEDWTTISTMTGLSNAYIIVCLSGYKKVKNIVFSICLEYSETIDSYILMDKANDSTDKR